MTKAGRGYHHGIACAGELVVNDSEWRQAKVGLDALVGHHMAQAQQGLASDEGLDQVVWTAP